MRYVCVLFLLPFAASGTLRTNGRYIVNDAGERVKLSGVNWYGADQKDFVLAGLHVESLTAIARRIREMGFNTVRLPWSNELLERNPVVEARAVAANPQFRGRRAMDVLDAAIDEITRAGLYVILDNHVSRADWCCNEQDGNGRWFTPEYPEWAWIADWQVMAIRYIDNPRVIGADLRNEIRNQTAWAEWRSAAGRCGNAILSVNPNLLIIVEGVNYTVDLSAIRGSGVHLYWPDRLVYSAHDYAWDHNGAASYDQIRAQLDQRWGWLLDAGVPVLLGEFGTCNRDPSCVQDAKAGTQGFWFASLIQYLHDRDTDWTYWAVNGTQTSGYSRTFGAVETYGIFNSAYDGASLPALLQSLQSVQPPIQ